MTPLTAAALATLPPGVAAPAYDRAAVRPGIAHLSVGNFHRAHQAWFLDRLLATPGHEGWGILGVGLLDIGAEREKAEALRVQDGLYTLTRHAPDGTTERRVIGSLVDYLHAPDDPEAVLARLADPAIRIVTMTITEGGYNRDPRTGAYDVASAEVARELAEPRRPRSAFGFIVEALRRRRDADVTAFTVQSCDNLPDNGGVTRQAVVAHARALDPHLADWIEAHVAFPSSMVDGITPAVGAAEHGRLNAASGVEDRVPVFSEQFMDWVVEDRFSAGRPAWEAVGVRMVADVRPYERAKLHLLNASHSMLAYPAQLAGIERVDQALAEPRIRALLEAFMVRDVVPMLEQPPGVDLHEYARVLLARFSNPAVGDQVARITFNGAAKLPLFWGPVLAETGGTPRLAFGLGCFLRYLRGEADGGARIAPNEPGLGDADRALAGAADPRAALGLEVFRASGVPADGPFADAIVGYAERVRREGALAVIADVVAA